MKHVKTKRPFNKKLVAIAVAAVLLVGGVTALLVRPDNANDQQATGDSTGQGIGNTINYDPPTEAEKREAEAQKQEIINKVENPPVAADLTVNITRAGQSSSGAPLNVRTIVSGATSGECTVILTRSGQATITRTFPIAFEATYSSCQGADIDAATFPVEGEWQLSVTAQSGGKTSLADTKKVNIDK